MLKIKRVFWSWVGRNLMSYCPDFLNSINIYISTKEDLESFINEFNLLELKVKQDG